MSKLRESPFPDLDTAAIPHFDFLAAGGSGKDDRMTLRKDDRMTLLLLSFIGVDLNRN